jgi:hypothetical protein
MKKHPTISLKAHHLLFGHCFNALITRVRVTDTTYVGKI